MERKDLDIILKVIGFILVTMVALVAGIYPIIPTVIYFQCKYMDAKGIYDMPLHRQLIITIIIDIIWIVLIKFLPLKKTYTKVVLIWIVIVPSLEFICLCLFGFLGAKW